MGKLSKGTASQNSQFLRPALGDHLRIEVKVLNFGQVIALIKTNVCFATSGEQVAHAKNEFVFRSAQLLKAVDGQIFADFCHSYSRRY